MRLLSTVTAISITLLVFSASFKIRFGFNELIALYLPAAALIGSSILANVFLPMSFIRRLKFAGLFLLLASASLYSFVLSGDTTQFAVFQRVIMNCTVAFFIVLFPWNKRSIDVLLLSLVVAGCVLSINTLLVHESLGDSLRGFEEEIREGYLNITLATAFGCVAALHRVIERFNPVSIVAFGVCAIGVAISLGRGSLIFCFLVIFLYVSAAFILKLPTLGRAKKVLVLLLLAAIVPVVVQKMMSIERTANRMMILFTDTESGAGVKGRTDVYRYALNTIYESPIFGNGLGAYMGDPVTTLGHPHNMFLQYMVDGGMIGLSILMIFLVIVVGSFFRALRLSPPSDKNTILACGALFSLMFLSYLKSHDAYRGLEKVIMSALPLIACHATLMHRSKRKRKRRSRRQVKVFN